MNPHPNSPAAIRARLAMRRDEGVQSLPKPGMPPLPEVMVPVRDDRPAPPVNPKRAARQAKKAAAQQITYRCGHTRSLPDIEHGNCPSCKEVNRSIKMKADREKRAKKGKPVVENRGRLPDGAQFAVEYDATRQIWTGLLVITADNTFSGEASGVEKLLRDLAQRYWESIAKWKEPTT